MIVRKSKREIEKIRESCQIVAKILRMLEAEIKPGVSTGYLDTLAETFIQDHGGSPAFKGYKIKQEGKTLVFPGSICASINDEVVHGIPNPQRYLREGDIISIDVGVKKNGYYGDSAWTFPVGDVNPDIQRLLDVTKTCLTLAIQNARAGNRVSDIASAVQGYAEKHNCSVVREYVGHGIGRNMHEEPQVPNYVPFQKDPVLKAGYTIAIEPMINLGSAEVRVLDDGWTVVTADGKWSAHFEHTVVILQDKTLVLTQLDEAYG
ncbi:MAG: type I methionyl aminopeptidase [Gemmatimonadetes bacterium]|nr:MAG: type I methionyl aminopeptidase [Gemmatimonadota bacterium]